MGKYRLRKYYSHKLEEKCHKIKGGLKRSEIKKTYHGTTLQKGAEVTTRRNLHLDQWHRHGRHPVPW